MKRILFFILVCYRKWNNILFLLANDWINCTIINIWYYENICAIFWEYVIAIVYLWLQDLLRFLFTQVRCKFWTRVQRNIAGSREKSRILTKRSLYRHFYPQCRYEPMPRIRRNDNARLLYIRRIFLIYDKINIFLYIIDHSKLLHFIKNY